MPNQPPLNPDAHAEVARMRDMVAEAIDNPGESVHEFISLPDLYQLLDHLAAALPEVTSVEELDQLPMHTYVQGDDGFKHAKDWNGGWHLIVNRPSSAPHLSGSIALPARVLYRPEVKP